MLNNIQNGWRPLINKIAIFLVVTFAVFTFLMSALPAVAQSSFLADSKWQCGGTQGLARLLSDNGEEITAVGTIGDDEMLFTLWINKETREWTAVATPGNKKDVSCIVLSGTKIRTLVPKISI